MGSWGYTAIRTTLPSGWYGMEWIEPIIAAIPSWLALREGESFISCIGGGGTVSCTPPLCTIPVQKRPDYKTYQQTTNMFLPGPNK